MSDSETKWWWMAGPGLASRTHALAIEFDVPAAEAQRVLNGCGGDVERARRLLLLAKQHGWGLMKTGTYNNHGPPVLTLDAIRTKVAEVEGLVGCTVPAGMTASAAVHAALMAHPEAQALLASPGATRLHEDALLPEGTWHKGLPRASR